MNKDIKNNKSINKIEEIQKLHWFKKLKQTLLFYNKQVPLNIKNITLKELDISNFIFKNINYFKPSKIKKYLDSLLMDKYLKYYVLKYLLYFKLNKRLYTKKLI